MKSHSEVNLPEADDAGALVPHLPWSLEVLVGCGISMAKIDIVDAFLKEIYEEKAPSLCDSSNFVIFFSLSNFLF